MARRTSMPKIKWVAYTYVEKYLASVRCGDHSALPYSYYFQIYKAGKNITTTTGIVVDSIICM